MLELNKYRYQTIEKVESTEMTVNLLQYDQETIEVLETASHHLSDYEIKLLIGDIMSLKYVQGLSKVTLLNYETKYQFQLNNNYYMTIKVEKGNQIQLMCSHANVFEEVNKIFQQYYEREVYLETLMPVASRSLPSHILDNLKTANILKCQNIEMPDYSVIAFSALRALEGYINYLLECENVSLEKSHKEVFEHHKFKRGFYLIKNTVKNKAVIDALEKSYNYYHHPNHDRNHIVHLGGKNLKSIVIKDKELAVQIVDEVTKCIEETYRKIK